LFAVAVTHIFIFVLSLKFDKDYLELGFATLLS
jgi:hypothetical protein